MTKLHIYVPASLQPVPPYKLLFSRVCYGTLIWHIDVADCMSAKLTYHPSPDVDGTSEFIWDLLIDCIWGVGRFKKLEGASHKNGWWGGRCNEFDHPLPRQHRSIHRFSMATDFTIFCGGVDSVHMHGL